MDPKITNVIYGEIALLRQEINIYCFRSTFTFGEDEHKMAPKTRLHERKTEELRVVIHAMTAHTRPQNIMLNTVFTLFDYLAV